MLSQPSTMASVHTKEDSEVGAGATGTGLETLSRASG